MASQTSVTDSITKGQAGTPADDVTIRTAKVDTGRVETAALSAGYFVIDGTADDQVVAPSGGSDVISGLLVHRDNRERSLRSDTAAAYAVNEKVGKAIDGVWWAYNEGAVAKGGQVYVRFTSGVGGSTIGIARADADTASAVACNASFAETKAASGICKIRLHFEQV